MRVFHTMESESCIFGLEACDGQLSRNEAFLYSCPMRNPVLPITALLIWACVNCKTPDPVISKTSTQTTQPGI